VLPPVVVEDDEVDGSGIVVTGGPVVDVVSSGTSPVDPASGVPTLDDGHAVSTNNIAAIPRLVPSTRGRWIPRLAAFNAIAAQAAGNLDHASPHYVRCSSRKA
jgi:hypothetical protein